MNYTDKYFAGYRREKEGEVSYELIILDEYDEEEIINSVRDFDEAETIQIMVGGALRDEENLSNLIAWITSTNYAPTEEQLDILRKLMSEEGFADDAVSDMIMDSMESLSAVEDGGIFGAIKNKLNEHSINSAMRKSTKEGGNLQEIYSIQKRTIQSYLTTGGKVETCRMSPEQATSFYISTVRKTENARDFEDVNFFLLWQKEQSGERGTMDLAQRNKSTEWDNLKEKTEKEQKKWVIALQIGALRQVKDGIKDGTVIAGYIIERKRGENKMVDDWKKTMARDSLVGMGGAESKDGLTPENLAKLNEAWKSLEGTERRERFLEVVLPKGIKAGRARAKAHLIGQEKPFTTPFYKLLFSQGIQGEDVKVEAINLMTGRGERELFRVLDQEGIDGLTLSKGNYDSVSIEKNDNVAQLVVILVASKSIDYPMKHLKKDKQWMSIEGMKDHLPGIIKNARDSSKLQAAKIKATKADADALRQIIERKLTPGNATELGFSPVFATPNGKKLLLELSDLALVTAVKDAKRKGL